MRHPSTDPTVTSGLPRVFVPTIGPHARMWRADLAALPDLVPLRTDRLHLENLRPKPPAPFDWSLDGDV